MVPPRSPSFLCATWPTLRGLSAAVSAFGRDPFRIGRRHRIGRAGYGRTATGAVSRLENGWAYGSWGFDSLSFLRRGGVAELERQRVASAQTDRPVRRFESCRLRVPVWLSREDARLLLARRRFESCRRSFLAPVVEHGDDAGLSTRKLRVRIPPGVLVAWS